MAEPAKSTGTPLSPEGAGRIGFLGTGNLTDMLVRRLAEVGYAPDRMTVSRRNPEIAKQLQAQTGVHISDDLQQIAEDVDCLVICLPQSCAATELAALRLRPDQLVISMVGGLGIHALEGLVSPARAFCAMLPGLPSSLGAGLTLVYPAAPEGVTGLLEHFGAVLPCETPGDFDRLSTYGGLSGCLFHQAHEMEQALSAIGVRPDQARTLLGNAFLGVGKTLLADQAKTLNHLVSQVVTPGGITEKGIGQLETAQLGRAWTRATASMLEALNGHVAEDVGLQQTGTG